MFFRSKRDILREQKFHYKMPKLKKRWLVTGLTALGLSLGISIPVMQVQAESQPVKTVDKKAMPAPQKPKAAIAPSNLVSGGTSRDYFSGISENYSTSAPFSEEFHNQTMSSVPRKTGYIKAGSDKTGALRLMYFHGTNANGELTSQIGTGWNTGSFPYGYNQGEVANAISGSDPSPKYPMFMIPNFAIRRGDGSIWSWLFYNGDGKTSSPFLAGINDDWNTADMGSNWRFWSIEQSSTDDLNSVITLKFTGDFTFRTNHTYTLDFTMTLKPNGSNVDYNLAIRNVTSLVNPAMSQADAELPKFWFASQFDTMLGDGENRVNGADPDYVPLYYIGENQGLYLNYGGYKLSFNFTSKNAPTGWGAANWQQTSFAAAGIETPASLGQNGNNGEKDTVAFQAGDSALHLVWRGRNLASGDTREANYQVSISSQSAILPKIKLDRMTDKYTGGAYTVSGKVTYPGTGNLTYYYAIDSGEPVKFEGPQNMGSETKPFRFTIPNGKMVPGENYQISVYAVDENGNSSETQNLKLTAYAEIFADNKTYYTGEKFEPFGNLLQVNGVTREPLTEEQIKEHVTIKVTKSVDFTDKDKVVPESEWNQITSDVREYKITYTYHYGKAEDQSVSGEGRIYVISRRYIALRYVDQHHQPIDPSLLTEIPAEMKPDERFYGPFDSEFELIKIPELSLDGKKYYDFLRFEEAPTPEYPDVPPVSEIMPNEHGEYKVPFDAFGRIVNVVYQGVKTQLTVHHELRKPDGTTVPVPGMNDDTLEGAIGETIPLEPTQAHPGYDLEGGQEGKSWTFKPGENNEFTFYYTASSLSNITVKFVNINNLNQVGDEYIPQGHVTGDTLDLTAQNQELITKIPDGYHYASAADLDGKTDASGAPLKQPGKLKYTSEAQHPQVYVVAESQENITVHFVNLDTNEELLPAYKPKGHVTDDELDLSEQNQELITKIPEGYHYASAAELKDKKDDNGQDLKQPGKLKYTNEAQNPKVYVAADPQENITVRFVNAKNGAEVETQTPPGYTNGELDLNADSNYIRTAMPKGYRYAEATELPKGKTQPGKLTYKTTPQTAIVYVMGKPTDASSRVTVHHYLEGTTTTVPGMRDTYVDGYIGDTKTISKNDPDQKAPAGYTIAETPQSYTWEFKADTPKEVAFYYKGNSQNNITVKFIRLEDGKEILPSYIPQGHKTGDELDLSEQNQELITAIPKGYRYATDDELRNKGITRPGNPQYTTSVQTATVYVVPKPAEKPIKVELINIKNPADKISGETDISNIEELAFDSDTQHLVYTIDPKNTDLFNPKPHVYDAIDWQNYIAVSTSNDIAVVAGKLQLPAGYKIATPGDLKALGLTQEVPKFGLEEVKTKFYVVKNEATYNLKIHHIVRGSKAKVPGLRATTQEVKPDSPFTIDTNDRAHLAPRGYRIIGASLTGSGVDRKYPFNPRTGLITGTVPDKTKFEKDGENSYKDFYIVYDKY